LERLGFSSRQRNAIPRRPAPTQNNIKSVLLWLWDVAVKPVLDTTKLTETRRIWWITNGLMALAPIHAAGDHSRGSQENTLSRAISSYISSFKALSYARRTRAPVLQPRKVLLVTMPSTPGHQSLDVRAETQIIQSSFGSRVATKEQPTGAEVLSHMPHYSIVHFACHGYLSTLSPSDSGLIFAQGSKSEVLPISSIERISTSNAEIAFLSACSTAELSFGSHIDEAINLANCFQILGFRHVIGTIWSASDHSAGAVATKFYTRLADQISSATEELDVALALHEAIREYDGECEGDDGPLHWGPYIHVGT
jgi:CHAT domain-containing protein